MVKTQFSIKDLENLSGVKAHTIRIWEKRYSLLDPLRTDTNIRKYDLESLKKLLNVTYLYNDGHKISKIAELNSNELARLIEKQACPKNTEFVIQAFKTAMFDFDLKLFSETYNSLLKQLSFSEIYLNIFLPFLNEIGLLWQTGTIDPAHERFISELVKQKIILGIEKSQNGFVQKKETIFTLYLPHQEIHEIGLLYANYELLKAGFKTIYLGANIPLESLNHVLKHHENIIFLTSFTVQPENKNISSYLNEFLDTVCSNKFCKLWIMGPKSPKKISEKMAPHITTISELNGFNSHLDTLS